MNGNLVGIKYKQVSIINNQQPSRINICEDVFFVLVHWLFKEVRTLQKIKMILNQLKTSPVTIDFKEVISYIDGHYDFTPTKFTNGNTVNEADQNNGSCKIFSFGKLNELSKDDTLALFGAFYREDVMKNPEGTDHQNIRNFMEFGWEGISFEGKALRSRF